jgi:GT2 family glycosyltransferase
MAKIYIAIPTYDKKVDIEIMQMFAQLLGRYPQHDFALDFIQSSLISYARNFLATRFMENDFEWLYFWDADLVIRNPKFIEYLLETAEKLDAKVVGGAYMLKSPYGKYAQGNRDKKSLHGIKNFIKGELKEPMLVDALCTGTMLIHRSVLEKMKEPYFTVTDIDNGNFIPEDYNFCAHAKKLGFKVALDPRFNTYHFGTAFWEHTLETPEVGSGDKIK